MNLRPLQQQGRQPPLPWDLQLPSGSLRVIEWLRTLPGQRYVGLAEWRGRRVLAKLFVGSRAQRHWRREKDGIDLMTSQGLTTPALLDAGLQRNEGGWLLLEFIEEATSLWQAWTPVAEDAPLSAGQHAVLRDALKAIAEMHGKGLWQSDLHLDNLLRRGDTLYLIDGGGIRAEQPGTPLSQKAVLENLGLFFAQLPSALDGHLETLGQDYLDANATQALPMDGLRRETARARSRRLEDFLGKLGRDCSLFSVRQDSHGFRAVVRADEDALDSLLRSPDEAIAQGVSLKQGGSATVAQCAIDGRPLVVKRYNIKGFGHWLKRFWRPSRAWHSWVEGNRLLFHGIATPRPLAMIERRTLGLRGRAYLVTDYLAGEDALGRLAAWVDSGAPAPELQALLRLFEALRRERISHGDLKGTNLLWDGHGWALIDLDAMQAHDDPRSFEKAYAIDRERFLRNWPRESALYRQLDERLPLAD